MEFGLLRSWIPSEAVKSTRPKMHRLLFILLIYFYMFGYFVCLSARCTCLVPQEARREPQISRDWVSVVNCCVGSRTQTRVPCKSGQCSLLTAEPSLRPVFRLLVHLPMLFMAFYFGRSHLGHGQSKCVVSSSWTGPGCTLWVCPSGLELCVCEWV